MSDDSSEADSSDSIGIDNDSGNSDEGSGFRIGKSDYDSSVEHNIGKKKHERRQKHQRRVGNHVKYQNADNKKYVRHEDDIREPSRHKSRRLNNRRRKGNRYESTSASSNHLENPKKLADSREKSGSSPKFGIPENAVGPFSSLFRMPNIKDLRGSLGGFM